MAGGSIEVPKNSFDKQLEEQKKKVEQVEKVFNTKEKADELSELEDTLIKVDTQLTNLVEYILNNFDKEAEKEKANEELNEFREQVKGLLKKVREKQRKKLAELEDTVKKSQEEKKNSNSSGQEKEGNKKNTDEEKNWLSRQWDGVSSKEERKENPMTNVARIAGGIGAVALVYKGISWLFGGNKSEKKSEKKEESGGSWKSLLKWTGIAGLGAYLGRGFLTGNWDFFGIGKNQNKKEKSGEETSPGSEVLKQSKSYEKLDENEKKIYNNFGDNINEYYGNVTGDANGVLSVEDMLGDSTFDEGKTGLIPWILDNRYNSTGDILSERSFFYEVIGTEGNVLWNKMKDRSIDQLKNLIMPLLVGIDNINIPFVELNAVENTEEFLNKVKSIPGSEDRIRTVFRKSMSTISYLESRRRRLEYTLTYEYLEKNETGFNDMSEGEKKEKILDKMGDEEWFEKNIEPTIKKEFLDKGMKKAIVYMESKNVLDGELDEIVKDGIEKIDKRKNDLLEKDDEDSDSVLQDIKEELEGGKLSPKGKEKLQEFCKDWQEEIDGFGKKSRYNRYLPILEMLDSSDDTLDKILNSGDYERVVDSYMQKIGDILKKSEQGILTEEDFTDLENQVEDYYKFQKSIVATQLNLIETRRKDGSIVLTYVDTLYKSGETLKQGIQLVIDGGTWEKIKGGGTVVGAFASLDLLTWPLRSGMQMSFAKSPTAKVVYNISRVGLKAGVRGLNSLTGKILRSRTPYGLGAVRYNQHSFRVELARGDLSLDRALQIAKRKQRKLNLHSNAKNIETKSELLQSIFNIDEVKSNRLLKVLEEYGDNPKIYREILQKNYNKSGRRKIVNPKHRGEWDLSQKTFIFNEMKLQKLENISVRINQLGDTEKIVFKQAMRYTKSIDDMEDIVTMGIGPDMIEVLTPELYGKYLARYGSKIDANDMRAFEKFLIEAKKSGKITGKSSTFIRNSMRRFDKIKKAGFKVADVDKLHLNSGRWERLASETKAGVTKMVDKLSSMIKNPKYKPFHGGIQKQISALNEYRKTITPKGMKAVADMEILGNGGFNKLTEKGIQQMGKLNKLLLDAEKGKDLLKAIREAKTPETIREALGSRGISHADIADDVLVNLEKTKSAKKIKDIVNYGAEFRAIEGVQKLIKNPAVRYGGRVLGRALVGVDFVFQAYNFSSMLNEANEIKKTNAERGEWKESQAYFEGVSGGIGAVAGACMFIPGVGWVAGGVLGVAMVAQEVGSKYYKDIEKFKQNKQDFLDKGIAATKQELLSIDSWGSGLSLSFIDKMSGLSTFPTGGFLGEIGMNSITKKSAGLPKTKADALKALLRMEEISNYPYAYYSLDDENVRNDDKLRILVTESKNRLDKAVNDRFVYLEEKYIKVGKSLVSEQEFKGNKGIAKIENILRDSKIYATMKKDVNYQGEKDPDKYKQNILEDLQKDKDKFEKLETLFKNNNIEICSIYAELPQYMEMFYSFGSDLEGREEIEKNIEYFTHYMAYKNLGYGANKLANINIEEKRIPDYNRLHKFFRELSTSYVIENIDIIQEEGVLLSDEQIAISYNVTKNLGQNILYEIAKEYLGYEGSNILESSGKDSWDLKKFFHESRREVNGIYFDGSNWAINENNGSDDEFAKSHELNNLSNIENMRKYIDSNVNGSFINGDMFTESSEVNKEMGNKFLKIIDANITLRKNQNAIKKEIEKFIEQNSKNGEYIRMPEDLLIKGTKAGISGLGGAVFSKKGDKIEYKTTFQNYVSPF